MSAPLVERAPCGPAAPLRVGVLVSGSGTNLQALLDRNSDAYRIVVVGSNKAEAYALERARNNSIPTFVESHRAHPSREAFDRALVDALGAHDVEMVVLAGFMRVLTSSFLDAFPRRVLNVHPALCPAFPGIHAPRQALAHGVRITGCTVHLVDAGVDTGPILAQAAVPILDGDDEASLTARIQRQEHALLPAILEALAVGAVVIENGAPALRGYTPNHDALTFAR